MVDGETAYHTYRAEAHRFRAVRNSMEVSHGSAIAK